MLRMNHLPLQVPCVCDHRLFDGMGLILQSLLDPEGWQLTLEAIAQVLRAWPFLGLMIEVLKREWRFHQCSGLDIA